MKSNSVEKRQTNPMKNKRDISNNTRDKHPGKKNKGLITFKSVSSWNTGFSQTPVRHLSVGVIR